MVVSGGRVLVFKLVSGLFESLRLRVSDGISDSFDIRNDLTILSDISARFQISDEF